MANLLDTIRQTSGQVATQQQGITDDTAQAQKLLAAKRGKAATGGDIAASNLGEQQAVAQTNQQMMGNVAPEAAVQQGEVSQEAAGIQQNQQNQEAQIAQGNQFNALQNQIKITQTLNDLTQKKQQLDVDRDRAQVQQLGQSLRLSNEQYIDNLNRIGTMDRLNDQTQFEEQLKQTTFGANKDLVEKQLGNKSILDANDREWKKYLAQMGIDQAQALFRDDQRKAASNAWNNVLGSAGKQGAGMAGSAAASSSSSSSNNQPAGSNIDTSGRGGYNSDSSGGSDMEGYS